MRYNPLLDRINCSSFYGHMAQSPQEIVQKAEDRYQKRIDEVCDRIIREKKCIVLVTGPSASGKTTTAQKISLVLQKHDKKVSTISLDNFYRHASELPRWKDGYQNYESIEGLDIPYFENRVTELLTTGHSQFPLYDFSVNERSAQSVDLTFDQDTILIFEGIHALNPLISQPVSDFSTLRIYVSVHSDFVDSDGQVLFPARDLRLTRRVLRDYTYRNTSAEGTFRMWDYVMMGEKLYIRPFRKYADCHIDSTHSYEPFLYHDDILTALDNTPADSHYAEIVLRLRESAEHFFGISSALIPETSLIREFMKP